jgi:glutathione peroxidase
MRRLFLVLAAILFLGGTTMSDANAASAHDFSFTAIEGGELAVSNFKGKPILLVNVASECGFTPQYENLQAVWENYRDRGLVVLGVPSNDFGGQEPGTETEILAFCEARFGIDFPMTAKEKVIGPDAHPLYRWIEATLGEAGTPRWNFHKYLISPEGELVEAWPSSVKPDGAEVTQAIEANLPD